MDAVYCLFFRTRVKHLHAQREAASEEKDRRTLDFPRPNYSCVSFALPLQGRWLLIDFKVVIHYPLES